MASFAAGMKYPWAVPARLLNILWVLIPVVGVFTLYGYIIKVITGMVQGQNSLPDFGDWGENTKEGFFLILRMIPFMIVFWIVSFVLMFIPVLGQLAFSLLCFLFVPWLVTNLIVKRKVSAAFDVQGAAKAVFGNFGGYIMALVRTVGFAIVYGLLSMIVIGIPALLFGQNYYLARFYGNK